MLIKPCAVLPALLVAMLCLPAAGQDQVVQMNSKAAERTETTHKLLEPTDLRSIMTEWFGLKAAQSVAALTEPTLGSHILPEWTQIDILWGPTSDAVDRLVPYRITISTPRESDGLISPNITIALNDSGQFVVAPTRPRWPEPGVDVDGRTSRHAAN